jgi:predicted lipid-binding transport protein (Tim44 family)
MTLRRLRPWALAALVLTAMAFVVTEVDARAGRGFSFGSRGARTYTAPPPTRTAPTQAAPIQRSTTQPTQAAPSRAATAARPAAGGVLGRPGFIGGLAAGFLGAGLIGLLLGHGFLGGLGGLASVLGLLLQVGLVAMAGWLAWNWWQRRNAPALAASAAGGPSYARTGLPVTGLGGAGGAHAAGPAFGARDEVEIVPADYDAFEELLRDVQQAYGKEDIAALRLRVTPEILSYFAEEFADNASRGVLNRIADVKLLQGDLAEAWREGSVEYATVAMTFELVEQTVDRQSGRVVDGDTTPTAATELWTFRRAGGGQWLLSAIQQTG